MALHLRTAGRAVARPAAHHRGSAVAVLLAVATISLLAGALMLGSAFSPMFGQRSSGGLVANPFASAARATIPSPSTTPSSATPSATVAPPPPPAHVASESPVDGVSFELRVPAIGYRAMVHEGVTQSVLSRGPGHYTTTSWPGQRGNVGIAAHDSYWLSFARIAVGDRVELVTQHSVFAYSITGWKIVDGGDRTVLAQTRDNRVTMTTCYPLWSPVTPADRIVWTAREIT